MKTAISIPDQVFHEAEEFAARQGLTRSELYTRAVVSYLESHRAADVTRKLNDVYRDEDSALDPLIGTIQGASLAADRW